MDPFKNLKLDLAVVLLGLITVSLLMAGVELPNWQEAFLLGLCGLAGAGYLMLRTSARVRQLRRTPAGEDSVHGPKQEQ